MEHDSSSLPVSVLLVRNSLPPHSREYGSCLAFDFGNHACRVECFSPWGQDGGRMDHGAPCGPDSSLVCSKSMATGSIVSGIMVCGAGVGGSLPAAETGFVLRSGEWDGTAP